MKYEVKMRKEYDQDELKSRKKANKPKRNNKKRNI